VKQPQIYDEVEVEPQFLTLQVTTQPERLVCHLILPQPVPLAQKAVTFLLNVPHALARQVTDRQAIFWHKQDLILLKALVPRPNPGCDLTHRPTRDLHTVVHHPSTLLPPLLLHQQTENDEQEIVSRLSLRVMRTRRYLVALDI